MTSLPETFSKLYSRMPSLYPLRFRSNFAQEMSDAFDRCLDELFEKGPINFLYLTWLNAGICRLPRWFSS